MEKYKEGKNLFKGIHLILDDTIRQAGTGGYVYQRQKIILGCEYCENEFECKPYDAKFRRYCSQSCSSKGMFRIKDEKARLVKKIKPRKFKSYEYPTTCVKCFRPLEKYKRSKKPQCLQCQGVSKKLRLSIRAQILKQAIRIID